VELLEPPITVVKAVIPYFPPSLQPAVEVEPVLPIMDKRVVLVAVEPALVG
jgi:hypothetical protein